MTDALAGEVLTDPKVRGLLAERLGVDLDAADPESERARLERERLAIAPEALAGDPDAQADFAAIDEQLRELELRGELEQLAGEESARREREAERAAASLAHAQQEARKVELEQERDIELARVERALASLTHAAACALMIDVEIETLAQALGESHQRLRGRLEDRFAWRLKGLVAGPVLYGKAGREPLATRRCIVCAHPEREAIEAASKVAGTSMRALEEQYGVSRTVLSRHLSGHR